MQSNQKLQKQFSLNQSRLTALVLLWTLFSASFSPIFAYALETPEGMVYCPLSKKFQPISPPAKKKEAAPFSEMCASRERKDFLFQEIVIKNPFKHSLGERNLDDLAFDFLAHGISALKEMPNVPYSPCNTSNKYFALGTKTNQNYEPEIACGYLVQHTSLTLKPRPPTVVTTVHFADSSIHQSPEISRHLVPRAPPLFS